MTPTTPCSGLVTSACLVLALLAGQSHGRLFTVTKPDSDVYCVMMDAEFQILVIAQNSTDGSISKVHLNSNATGVLATGSCARSATITLSYAGNAFWSNVFTTSTSGGVILDRVFQFYPNKLFQSDSFPPKVVTFNDPGKAYLSQDDQSFLCLRQEQDEYLQTTTPLPGFKFRVIGTVDSIHAQAFNIKNNAFSPAVNCEDLTTTSTPSTSTTKSTTPTPSTSTTKSTTPTPTAPTSTPKSTDSTPPPSTTTPSGEAPLNVYRVNETGNNASCIVLASRIRFSIPYHAKTAAGRAVQRLAEPVIPADATHTGNCSVSETEQSLEVNFLNGWAYQVLFTKTATNGLQISNALLGAAADSAGQRDLDYGISKVSLTYVFDEAHFPSYDSALNNGTQTVSGETDLPHKPSGKDFYDCLKETELKLSRGVKTMAKDFKFKAFNADADGSFDGKAAECAADEGTNYLLPIILGTVFCGIILLILIVFGIVRYRRHMRYDRV